MDASSSNFQPPPRPPEIKDVSHSSNNNEVPSTHDSVRDLFDILQNIKGKKPAAPLSLPTLPEKSSFSVPSRFWVRGLVILILSLSVWGMSLLVQTKKSNMPKIASDSSTTNQFRAPAAPPPITPPVPVKTETLPLPPPPPPSEPVPDRTAEANTQDGLTVAPENQSPDPPLNPN